jgi:RluA family pseudouridine synthase
MSPLTTLTSTIHNNPDGISLLDYLCKRFSYKTRESWIEAIADGYVVINGEKTTPDQVLKLKDQISYTSERNEPPVATDIQTIFEDEHLLVVNKPAPLPVHAQGVFILHTLIHMLRQKTNNPDLGLGHRLDRETTGIIVLAKQRELTGRLMARIEDPKADKSYLAVVRGEVDFEEKLVEGWMGPSYNSLINRRWELVQEPRENYKQSATKFILKKKLKGSSLLEGQLHSGRTNQIRVHLEAAGYPIVGDKLYGRKDEEYLNYLKHLEKRGAMDGGGDWDHPRQLLHSWRLAIHHPVSNEWVDFEAPMPEDMKTYIENNQ